MVPQNSTTILTLRTLMLAGFLVTMILVTFGPLAQCDAAAVVGAMDFRPPVCLFGVQKIWPFPFL